MLCAEATKGHQLTSFGTKKGLSHNNQRSTWIYKDWNSYLNPLLLNVRVFFLETVGEAECNDRQARLVILSRTDWPNNGGDDR